MYKILLLLLLPLLSACVVYESEARKVIKAEGTGVDNATIIMAAHEHCYVLDNPLKFAEDVAERINQSPPATHYDAMMYHSLHGQNYYVWKFYDLELMVAKECVFKTDEKNELDVTEGSQISQIISYFREI